MDDDIYSPRIDYSPEKPPDDKSPFEKMGASLVDFIQTLVVFGAIFAIIYLFLAQPHKVSGNSMVPTFLNGDYILTDKVSYRFNYPKGGDVIVLKNPRDESQDFIKRIIAGPNQILKLENNVIFVDGQPLSENYLPIGTPTHDGSFIKEGQILKVGPNQYFVFGDNRAHSSDSREWGSITKEEIVGKVFFRYWPPNKIGLFKSFP